jgi:hypothetical protein
MVWNTNEELELMGRKREPHMPGPGVHSDPTPYYSTLPTYARLQMPLTDNDARIRRMADDLRRLASQIEFCINRQDLSISRRLHLIHLDFRFQNQRWLDEAKSSPQFTQTLASQRKQKYTKSGGVE